VADVFDDGFPRRHGARLSEAVEGLVGDDPPVQGRWLERAEGGGHPAGQCFQRGEDRRDILTSGVELAISVAADWLAARYAEHVGLCDGGGVARDGEEVVAFQHAGRSGRQHIGPGLPHVHLELTQQPERLFLVHPEFVVHVGAKATGPAPRRRQNEAFRQTIARMPRSSRPRGRVRVLLTGNRGTVGRWLGPLLKAKGYEVHGFDVRDGCDIRRPADLASAARHVDVVVHAATIGLGYKGPATDFAEVNVGGAENVLAAAEAAGHERAVVFSSPHVFGTFSGEALPVSFPLRDDHPRLAEQPYGKSKVQVEDLCAAFSARSGMATLCPRPVRVWYPGWTADFRRRLERGTSRMDEADEYAAFLDVRDLAAAIQLALSRPVGGHHRFLLSANDAAALHPTRTLAERAYPGVPFEPGWPPDGQDRAALIDCGVARDLFGWAPVHNWAEESRLSLPERVRGRLGRTRELGWRGLVG
jgi:UDP-glucose 4-epimerase